MFSGSYAAMRYYEAAAGMPAENARRGANAMFEAVRRQRAMRSRQTPAHTAAGGEMCYDDAIRAMARRRHTREARLSRKRSAARPRDSERSYAMR